MTHLKSFLFALLFLATFGLEAQAGKRVALLIGNAAYTGSIDALINPHKDVALVKAALLKVGFAENDIIIAKDAGFRGLHQAVSKYVRKLRDAGPGATGFFYYSGHGAANQDTRVNYLIPVDVTSIDSAELWDSSMRLEEIIDKLKTGAKNANHFVIFDACRNTLRLSKQGTKAILQSKGFQPIRKVQGMLIAYATAEGETASDGDKTSGPYAKALSEELVKPGVEAVTMFRAVQLRVFENNGQDPWLTYGKLPEFFFAGRYKKRQKISSGAARSVGQSNQKEIITALLARISTLQNQCLVKSPEADKNTTGETYALLDSLECIIPRASPLLLNSVREGLKTENAREIMQSPLRLRHFLTQIFLETGGLRRIEENTNYSTKTLLRVFSRRNVSVKKAKEFGGKPKEIANWIYGNRIGNRGRDTNDGWDYRGSGYLQITGRTNFISTGKRVGVDLENSPHLLREPIESFQIALALWKDQKANEAADKDDLRAVRVRVNGPAAHGWKQSKVWYKATKKCFKLAKQGIEN